MGKSSIKIAKNKHVGARLTDKEYNDLEKLAQDEELDISNFTRNIIKVYLEVAAKNPNIKHLYILEKIKNSK